MRSPRKVPRWRRVRYWLNRYDYSNGALLRIVTLATGSRVVLHLIWPGTF